jgi:uncharacterized membrane protein YgcG
MLLVVVLGLVGLGHILLHFLLPSRVSGMDGTSGDHSSPSMDAGGSCGDSGGSDSGGGGSD